MTELIADYLPTFCQLVAAQPVVVYRITGQCKTILPSKATATDWLRMLVREEAIHPKATEASQSALDSISLNPGESWLAASARLVRYKRASLADAGPPTLDRTKFLLALY